MRYIILGFALAITGVSLAINAAACRHEPDQDGFSFTKSSSFDFFYDGIFNSTNLEYLRNVSCVPCVNEFMNRALDIFTDLRLRMQVCLRIELSDYTNGGNPWKINFSQRMKTCKGNFECYNSVMARVYYEVYNNDVPTVKERFLGCFETKIENFRVAVANASSVFNACSRNQQFHDAGIAELLEEETDVNENWPFTEHAFMILKRLMVISYDSTEGTKTTLTESTESAPNEAAPNEAATNETATNEMATTEMTTTEAATTEAATITPNTTIAEATTATTMEAATTEGTIDQFPAMTENSTPAWSLQSDTHNISATSGTALLPKGLNWHVTDSTFYTFIIN